jgi:isoleucyl-tRNA synthetase
VSEGLAVEADENCTIALDLKITPELRQICIARELVNRIQNRRKEMDLQITDKIRICVRGAAGVGAGVGAVGAEDFLPLREAIDKHRAYILEETQGLELSVGGEASGDAAAEWAAANVEGWEIEVAVGKG